MKFYIYKKNFQYLSNIIKNKLNAVYIDDVATDFFKNGKLHNFKNAAFITSKIEKGFYLNGIDYGSGYSFTKQSWRRFVKLQAFL